MIRHASLLTPTLRALFWKLLERGGSKALRLIVQIILARILSPEEFGVLAILIVFINFGDILVNGGLAVALIQSSEENQSYYSTAFWLSVAFAVVVFSLLMLLAPGIALLYDGGNLEVPLRVLALQFFPLAFNNIQVAKTTKHLNMKPVFIGSISAEVIASCIAIVLAVTGFGVWSLVVQQLASAVFTCLCTATMVRWFPSFDFNKMAARDLLSFGWRAMATDFVNNISGSLYTLAMGKLYSVEQLGYYSQGSRYPLACSDVLISALTPVLLAGFSSKNQGSAEALNASLGKAQRMTLMVLCPIFVALGVFAEDIIRVLLTEKWLPCVVVFQLFCVIALVRALSLVQRQALFAKGDGTSPLVIAATKLPVSILLLVGISHFGLSVTWAAVAWLASCVIEQTMSSVFCMLRLHYSLMDQLRDCLLPVVLTLPPYLLCLLLNYIQMPSLVCFGGFAILSVILVCVQMKHERRLG